MNRVSWKPVPGYECLYEVSNTGLIRSLDGRGKTPGLRKPQKSHKGYLTVRLYKNGKGRSFQIHRLVAMAFIPNKFNLPQVNHIDTNKENNTVANLEWISGLDNMRHAFANGCFKNAFTEKTRSAVMKNLVFAHKARHRKVVQIDKNTGNVIRVYDSIAQAEKETGAHNSKIVSCCKGKRKTTKGYMWKYGED